MWQVYLGDFMDLEVVDVAAAAGPEGAVSQRSAQTRAAYARGQRACSEEKSINRSQVASRLEVLDIFMNTTEGQGFEAWRKISGRFGPTAKGHTRSRLLTLLNPG